MNKIYRVVWNEITATWVAVAEIAKGHGKGSGSGTVGHVADPAAAPASLSLPPLKALVASLALIGVVLPAPTFAQVAANQLPTGGNVVAGSATITQNAAVMNINQTTNRAAIDWNTFNVGSAAQVNFNQPSSSSVTLNRVLDSNPSHIFGRITAPGQVFLVNPNGVFFAPGSSVDVGGLVATTHRIGVDDFMAGSTTFDRNGSSGSVVNQGELKAALGGYIALLAPEVRNEGVIIAQAGTVALASGEAITLNFGENGTLAGLTATQSQIAALVENKNAVFAPGGLIILSAMAVNSLQGGVINHSGSLEASSLTAKGGRIILEGDRVLQQGSITASGGDISIKANDAYFGQGVTSVANPEGVGGNISVLTSTNLDAVAGHLFDASGASGGNILVDGGEAGSILASASFVADGSQGMGGSVKLTAHQVSLLSAQVSANGVLDGGTINIGGEWQGGGDLRHADNLLVNAGSSITSKASHGEGGVISFWSSDLTIFDGTADVTGATKGGEIEVSSLGDLAMNGTLFAGQGGSVLFDPKNITISSATTSATWIRTINRATFSITDTQSDSRDFGKAALAFDGDLLAIADSSIDTYSGAVYLFTGANSLNYGSLSLAKTLKSATGAVSMPTLSANDYFGSALAIDNGRLAVGASGDDTGVSNGGAVYLFDGVGTDFTGLTYRSKLSSGSGATSMPTFNTSASFGGALSLDGDRLVVAAQHDNTGGTGTGAVHLFTGLNSVAFGSVVWQSRIYSGATSVAAGMPIFDVKYGFGSGVSLDGNLLAIGAQGEGYWVGSTLYNFPGSVFLFNMANSSNFSGLTYKNTLTSGATSVAAGMPTFANDDNFGSSVALSNGRLVVGSKGDDTGNTGAGALYVFSGTGSDFSNLSYQLTIENGLSGLSGANTISTNDAMGMSLALDGDHLIAGGQGNVRLFNLGSLTTDSVASATYSNNPGANSTITPDTITTLLNAGTAVTLQANNDITVSSAVTTINPGGAGGAFTLLAGRSIAINAAITTDDGAFTAVAGDAGADAANKDAGTSALTVGAAINTGAGAVSLTSAGTISGSGSITTTNQNLTLSAGSGSGTLSGILGMGSGSLTKAGAGTIILSGNNTYTGTTNIDAGTLQASHANALGTTAGNTVVASGATLAVTNNINLAEPLQLSGTGMSNAGALNLLGTTANTYSGNITLAAATSIVGATGTQTLSGTINGAQSLSMTSTGNWALNGNIGATTKLTGFSVKAAGNITQAASTSVTTNNGNITYWADSDASGAGHIKFGDSVTLNSANGLSNQTTGGGAITLAGGADSGGAPGGYAASSTDGGISFGTTAANSVAIYSGGGNILMRGRSSTTGSPGLYIWNGGTINSGNGTISLTGEHTTTNPNHGMELGYCASGTCTSTMTLSSGGAGTAITLAGSNLGSSGGTGIQTWRTNLYATGTGGISITGSTGSSSNKGLNFLNNTEILAASGAITLDSGARELALAGDNGSSPIWLGAKDGTPVTSSSSAITLTGDALSFANAVAIKTTGALVAQSSGTAFSAAQTFQNLILTGVSGVTLGKSTNTQNIVLASALSASGQFNIYSTGTVTDTGTGSIVAGSLALLGTGGNYTLDSTSNNVTTLAANTGSVSFYDTDGLTIGTVGATNGITATAGTVLVESGTGDIGIAQNISASSTGSSAIIINAGKTTSAGTAAGGNIVVTGSPSVTTGAGGRATLMTGSVTASTGLAALASAGNYRYNSDETATNFTTALGSGTYAIYREQPTVTVTAAAATKTYDGLAYAGGNGVNYSGFVNSETNSVLSGTVAYSGTSQGATNVGSYVITPSGLSNSLGYALAFANGTLTVDPAPLTVTASNASKTYDGLAYTGGNGVTYSGFVNSQTATVLGGTLGYAGTSQGATNAGSYIITPNGLTSSNYALAFANGTLTVNAAPSTTTTTTTTSTASPVIVPPVVNVAPSGSFGTSSDVSVGQTGANGISISIDRESTSGLGQAETQSVMLTISLPSDMATAGSGFSFELPSSVQALIENDLPMISLSDGSPLPDWIRFNSATMRFEAQAVPDSAFPLQVLISTSKATVLIAISERKE